MKDCILQRDEYILKTFSDSKQVSVRELQLQILDIMDEIHRVCIKNDIRYGLIAGSALGIVNYKGFIPWDDDMDICVLKEDWPRFIEAMKKDLSDEFYFHSFEVDSRYNVLIPSMKVRKKGTYIQEVNHLLENRCDGDGIFVDVIIYDNVSENKFIDQLYRLHSKLLMPTLVYLDNLGLKATFLKKSVIKVASKYGDKNKDSKFISQTIAFPWEKFLNEPVFLKEDVLPFKLYEFEGRKYYSYNNIEKILKKWYGPNCLKKWDGEKWVETLPEHKRVPKHVYDINLESDVPNLKKKNMISNIIKLITLLIIGTILLKIVI